MDMSNISLLKNAIKVQDFEEFLAIDVYERFKELFLKKNSNFLIFKNRIIKFPVVFSYFSYLGFNKEEGWKILKEMETRGLIEHVHHHGIRLKVDKDGK